MCRVPWIASCLQKAHDVDNEAVAAQQQVLHARTVGGPAAHCANGVLVMLALIVSLNEVPKPYNENPKP